MVPNVAGIIVKPVDFCYVACVHIGSEPRVIYLHASSCPSALLYVGLHCYKQRKCLKLADDDDNDDDNSTNSNDGYVSEQIRTVATVEVYGETLSVRSNK